MRVDVLGVKIDVLGMQDVVERIRRAVRSRAHLRIVTANPEMIYAAGADLQLRKIINGAGLVTPDGVGVVWAARNLGTPVSERVTGIDLVQGLLPYAGKEKWRVFFLGGKPGVAELAAKRISDDYPGLIWQAEHGYFLPEDEERIIRSIKSFQPDLLLVGLGAPRQEYWLAEHPGLATVCIGVGGSFDALAGVVKRAPQQIQALRMEWLYRLWKEPKRWRRQLVLPKFALRVCAVKFGLNFKVK